MPKPLLVCDHAGDPACPVPDCARAVPHRLTWGCGEPMDCEGATGKVWATVRCVPVPEAEEPKP